MPAPKHPKPKSYDAHLDARDIANRLNVSLRTAQGYMAMFDAQGKTFRCGKIIRVPVQIFDEWYFTQFGSGKVEPVVMGGIYGEVLHA